MENKSLLIVGIDPGTTTAYAVLDIDGKILHLKSSKQFDLNLLISEIINFGKVVLVGTDKVKIPGLVRAFATKLGAAISHPEEDLKVDEKREMVADYNFDDEHQADALASALFAYKAKKPLLDKINLFVEENKKQNIKNTIKELVISKNVSIKNAAGIIEGAEEEDRIIAKVIVKRELNEKDFLRLYNKLKMYESEIRIVKRYNSKLVKAAGELGKRIDTAVNPNDNIKRLADFREKRIKFLENALKFKEKHIENLQISAKKYDRIISNIGNFYILKKLNTLGANEFNFKNKVLNVKRNDLILVGNPNIASRSVVEMLKNNVFVIVHKTPLSKKIENDMPFVFISSKNLKIDEGKYFGFVEKSHFETEKSRIGWVKKIIDDYKKEKESLIRFT